MRIGELSRRTGVSPRSLRWYGEQQLLLEQRTGGGHREYADDAVERVELIQLLFAAGVPARHVVELLPCIYSGTTTPAMVARLEQERARVDAQARHLAETRDRLDGVLVEARARMVPAA
ncbi:MerR family transcriptional regulator [Pseudonocardia broussonetiae]|uniref:MerR family transcriptional regulator n=1 Tax=Pseudonocardia broussonetiae TaxID=2736640 RepID=A0A6M6JFD2_9PSEU|nr:MerR family transcriptional regulator [Pseudonocardia broussonetiae]QJY45201.1 MerR family transcriptional regulator [Pseudonocardia broussonetiae]